MKICRTTFFIKMSFIIINGYIFQFSFLSFMNGKWYQQFFFLKNFSSNLRQLIAYFQMAVIKGNRISIIQDMENSFIFIFFCLSGKSHETQRKSQKSDLIQLQNFQIENVNYIFKLKFIFNMLKILETFKVQKISYYLNVEKQPYTVFCFVFFGHI